MRQGNGWEIKEGKRTVLDKNDETEGEVWEMALIEKQEKNMSKSNL